MSEIAELFRGCATAQISDAQHRLVGSHGLRALHRNGLLLGTALTVRVRSGDNLHIHRALQLVRPGEVLVIDGGGDTSRALVGEILKRVAQSRGVRGFVVDGAVRDLDAFANDDFPCFARDVCLRGPYKHGPGEIGVPVTVGGLLVHSGDIVVGDTDGVVAIPLDQAQAVAAAARAVMAREAATLRAIAAGRYDDAWIEAAMAAAGATRTDRTDERSGVNEKRK